jgi:hypothetical protein
MNGARRRGRREELARLRAALKAAAIRFPFERGRAYPLRSLKEFEATLATLRQRNELLSKALRDAATCWWVKLRNDELIPLEYFAANTCLPNDATFTLMPQGSDVDIVIGNEGADVRLQVTTAGPVWSRPDGSTRDWGYDQHLMMRKLNAEHSVGGLGPFEEAEKEISNVEDARETEEIVRAFAEGLRRAFTRKGRLRTSDCELLVHVVGARKFPAHMFRDMVARARTNLSLENFKHVHVLDDKEGCYLQVR